jgi:hypothetical protein
MHVFWPGRAQVSLPDSRMRKAPPAPGVVRTSTRPPRALRWGVIRKDLGGATGGVSEKLLAFV